jgi:hypothetical protein
LFAIRRRTASARHGGDDPGVVEAEHVGEGPVLFIG